MRIVKNVLPYDEIFTGSNYKSYRSRYFIAEMVRQIDDFQKQDCEVNDIGWYSYEECMNMIRENHQEKKDILSKIHQLISVYVSKDE